MPPDLRFREVRRATTLLLTAALSLCLPFSGHLHADESDLPRDRLERLRGEIEHLSRVIAGKSEEKDTLKRLLAETDALIAGVNRRLRELDARLATQTALLDDLRAQRSGLAETLQRQRSILGRQIRAAYMMGRQEQIKLLLNQRDPSTVSRVMTYYDYVGRARAERMAEIRAQMQRLDDMARRIAAEERDLGALYDRQADELATLNGSQQTQRDLLTRLDAELADQGRRLARMQTDERELEALLRRLERDAVDQAMDNPAPTPFVERRGSLPWPAGGDIVHRYGTQRLGSLVWDGVMIAAPGGDEVRAVHHGRVAYADWLRGFGLLVIVDHGDGYLTLYGHNETLFKEVGDWVDEREPVALVGAGSGRQRPAIYFGIRYQGRSVNPSRWLGRSEPGGRG